MKMKLFGAMISALMFAVAAPAGAATVTGTSIVNPMGTLLVRRAAWPFNVSDLANGAEGINGAPFANGNSYFDYIFSFVLPNDQTNVGIHGNATVGTHLLDFHAALFSSSPAGTDLLVGSTPSDQIDLADTTGLMAAVNVSGGTVLTGAGHIGPGTFYLRLFGTIEGVGADSKLTKLKGGINVTPIPAGLPLFMTSLCVMGFMIWKRTAAAAPAPR